MTYRRQDNTKSVPSKDSKFGGCVTPKQKSKGDRKLFDDSRWYNAN